MQYRFCQSLDKTLMVFIGKRNEVKHILALRHSFLFFGLIEIVFFPIALFPVTEHLSALFANTLASVPSFLDLVARAEWIVNYVDCVFANQSHMSGPDSFSLPFEFFSMLDGARFTPRHRRVIV